MHTHNISVFRYISIQKKDDLRHLNDSNTKKNRLDELFQFSVTGSKKRKKVCLERSSSWLRSMLTKAPQKISRKKYKLILSTSAPYTPKKIKKIEKI